MMIHLRYKHKGRPECSRITFSLRQQREDGRRRKRKNNWGNDTFIMEAKLKAPLELFRFRKKGKSFKGKKSIKRLCCLVMKAKWKLFNHTILISRQLFLLQHPWIICLRFSFLAKFRIQSKGKFLKSSFWCWGGKSWDKLFVDGETCKLVIEWKSYQGNIVFLLAGTTLLVLVLIATFRKLRMVQEF